MNLDREYRTRKIRDGGQKKPGPVWISLDYPPKTKDLIKAASIEAEIEILKPYRGK